MFFFKTSLFVVLFGHLTVCYTVKSGYYPQGFVGGGAGGLGIPLGNLPITSGLAGGNFAGAPLGYVGGAAGISGGYTKKYTNVAGGTNVGGNYVGSGGYGHLPYGLGYSGYPGANLQTIGGGFSPINLGVGGFKAPYLQGAGYGGGQILPYGYGGAINPIGVQSYVTPIYHQGGGGEYVDKNGYSGENKNANNAAYEKTGGNQGEQANHAQEGYNHGKQAHRNGKSDSGHYNNEASGKKVYEDGKDYSGAQQFNQQGKNEHENKEQKSHKKGHKIHEFKNYHKKDESGNTEEYFDEQHDEGDHFNAAGKHGAFGENAGSQYKGGHVDGHFNNGQKGNQGHYNTEHFNDKSNANNGRFGENKFNKNGEVFGVNSGANQEALFGQQGASGAFKHQPFHHFY